MIPFNINNGTTDTTSTAKEMGTSQSCLFAIALKRIRLKMSYQVFPFLEGPTKKDQSCILNKLNQNQFIRDGSSIGIVIFHCEPVS